MGEAILRRAVVLSLLVHLVLFSLLLAMPLYQAREVAPGGRVLHVSVAPSASPGEMKSNRVRPLSISREQPTLLSQPAKPVPKLAALPSPIPVPDKPGQRIKARPRHLGSRQPVAVDTLSEAKGEQTESLASVPKPVSALAVSGGATDAIAQVANSQKPGAAAATIPTNLLNDSDDLRVYRLNLGREARRYRTYPALARERGWEGTSVLSVVAAPGLSLPQVQVGTSSGRDLLDDAAMSMIQQAIRVAELPDSLRGKAFKLTLPVRFALQD